MNLITPTPELPSDGKTKEKPLILIGVVILIAAGLYFVLGANLSKDKAEKKEAVKLINQNINEVEGIIDSVDDKANTFVLMGSDSKEYKIMVFPETTWSPKKDSVLKKGVRVKVSYIDAQKEVGLFYASSIEKIK